jgi:hypothetical protein
VVDRDRHIVTNKYKYTYKLIQGTSSLQVPPLYLSTQVPTTQLQHRAVTLQTHKYHTFHNSLKPAVQTPKDANPTPPSNSDRPDAHPSTLHPTASVRHRRIIPRPAPIPRSSGTNNPAPSGAAAPRAARTRPHPHHTPGHWWHTDTIIARGQGNHCACAHARLITSAFAFAFLILPSNSRRACEGTAGGRCQNQMQDVHGVAWQASLLRDSGDWMACLLAPCLIICVGLDWMGWDGIGVILPTQDGA